MKRISAILIILGMMAGCAHQPMPGIYASVAPNDALAILRQNADSIKTITAQGFITLTRPSGDSIRLDAVLVARMPGALHLRAWKFNRTVFDLTLTPAGLWMLAPNEPRMRQKIEAGKTGTIQFARAWALLTYDFFFSPGLVIRTKGSDFLITRQDATTRIVCKVDHATLTPTEYTLYDSEGRRQLVMHLENYEMHDGIAYPNRMIAESHFGQVDVRLREIHINTALAPGAFIPSPRAQRMQ